MFWVWFLFLSIAIYFNVGWLFYIGITLYAIAGWQFNNFVYEGSQPATVVVYAVNIGLFMAIAGLLKFFFW
jgi:hypothetical protein